MTSYIVFLAIRVAIPKVLKQYGMELIINQEKKIFENDALTVQQLLDMELPNKQKGIAIAIDQQVIPRSQWENTTVHSNQKIIIIKATQGG
ncbi:sulfur carrier protein ThiS [Flavobacterium davisii]|nr:sulfur carrier protein ThiS [Flavobacterium davisii]